MVRHVPNSIAGYNTMSAEEKKKVDINGLSCYMQRVFVAMGLTIIGGYPLLHWIGLTIIAQSLSIIVSFPGVGLILIKSRKYDKNQTGKGRYIVPAIAAVALMSIIGYGLYPTSIRINNDQIEFSGMYGTKIKVNEIEKLELLNKLPQIVLRTNGFSMGNVNKGYFNVDSLGRCRLLVNTLNSPLVAITQKNNLKLIFNLPDSIKTIEIYRKIEQLVNQRKLRQ